MAALESKLIVSLLDRLTGPAKGITAQIDKLTAASKANAARMDALRGQMMGAIGVGYALAKSIAAPAKAAIEWENSMLGVAKQLDGARDASGNLTPIYYEMGKAIQELGRVTPIANNDLAEMVTAGLRMGVAREEVLRFVEETAKMSTAFEMPAAELADSMGKIAGLYKIPIPAISELADTINYLDDNTISTGAGIISYLTRVGGIAGSVKIASKDMAALGSTLLSLGERTETAGTATNAMIQKFAAATKGTKKFTAAFKEIGLSTEAIQAGMQEDAFETILTVLDAVNKLPTTARIGVLSELVGLEHADTLAKLVTQTAELRRQRDLANSAAARGSMDREHRARLQTFDAQWQMTKNILNELGDAIGASLLPAFNALMKAAGPIIVKLAGLANTYPALTRAIVATTAGLVALRVAAIAAQFAFFWMKGGLISTAIMGLRGLRGALLGVGGAFRIAGRAARAARGAIAGASMLGAAGGGGLLSGMVAGVGTAVSAIMGALSGLVAGIAAITAPVWGVIAAILAAVLGLALAIYNYWVPISNFVSGFVSVIYDALSGLVSTIAGFGARIAAAVGGWVIDRVVDIAGLLGIDEATMRAVIDSALATISGFASSAVTFIKSIPAKVGGWIADIFTMNTYSDAATAGFRSAGERAGHALVDAVKAAINALIDWFKSLPRRIIAAIGKIDLSSIISWPSPPSWWTNRPSWLGGTGGESAAIAGARAAGGPVRAGSTYLVGERGPELVTFRQAGFVHDALKTARIAALTASATALPLPAIAAPAIPSMPHAPAPPRQDRPRDVSFAPIVNLTINAFTNANAREIAQEVKDVLSRELTDLYNGAFRDGVN